MINQKNKSFDQEYRVGVILDNFNLSKFEKENIEQLKKSNLNIKLYAILENKEKENILQLIFRRHRETNIIRVLEIIFFQILFKIEKFILGFFKPQLIDLDKKFLIQENIFYKIIRVKPFLSKYKMFSEYDENDVNKVLNEKLDIILRGNVSNIFRGDMLKISKFGIISFHHGDNSWNRGGPAGFWEVVLRKPATGFMIQILNENLNNGKIIFKGEFATKRTFSLNLYNLLCESNDFISDSIIKILNEQKVNIINSPTNIKKKIFKSPNFYFIFKYIFLSFKLIFNLFFQKFILRKSQRWEVSYSRSNFEKTNFSNTKKIKNLPGRFFADPFVIKSSEKHYVFVEDYIKKFSKGVISVIEIDRNDNHKYFSNIIEEKFHLSFPFIFKHENNLYMIPESSANFDIRLYKCVKFPDKWIYCHSLITDINCVDTIIFKKTNLYWLLTTTSKIDDFSSQLNIFFSNNPLSQNWKPHKKNPVMFNIDSGRNAGLIIKDKEEILRAIQSNGYNKYGDNQYGRKVNIKSIKELSEDNFEQILKFSINPDFKDDLLGTHHVNSIENFTVFDYNFYDFFK